MTGERLGPASSSACARRADGQCRGRSRDLDRPVAKWSLLFSHFNFREQGGPRGQAGPGPRSWSACWRALSGDARCAAATPAGGAGRGLEAASHPCSQGRQSRGVRHTHYLFLVLLTAGRILERGPDACRGPRPFALKGGPGPPRARLPPLPFQNLIQCSLVWGQGRERALVRGCYCVLPALTPHHKGFLRSPAPDSGPFLAKEPAHVGEQPKLFTALFGPASGSG